MNDIEETREIRMIPIDQIDVLNPRERNKLVFDGIVANIKAVGLKKPITVTPRLGDGGSERFLLICGEGRMKAYRALAQAEIPAIVVTVSDESALIMSLAENIARRKYHSLELLAGITLLRSKGYSTKKIAEKTGLRQEYICGIVRLLKDGEERLLMAVESGRIPLNAAMAIVGAGDDNAAVQTALQEAYESGKLRGRQLIQARRLIEQRQTRGRTLKHAVHSKSQTVTTTSLVKTYQKEVERQRQIVRKAEFAQERLLFVISAMRELLSDENFVTLLRAENLDSMPKYLAEQTWPVGRAA